jgi:SH3-like domain-containing protein
MRDTPGGSEVDLLAEGDLVTLLEDAPVDLNNFTWRRVRALGGAEGWVAQEFLEIRSPCQ